MIAQCHPHKTKLLSFYGKCPHWNNNDGINNRLISIAPKSEAHQEKRELGCHKVNVLYDAIL